MKKSKNGASETLLTPAEVAELFHVDPKTVTRWANLGKLHALVTPGGHRRFIEAEVLALRGSVPVSQPEGHGSPASSSVPPQRDAEALGARSIVTTVADGTDTELAHATETSREVDAWAAQVAAEVVARQPAQAATVVEQRVDLSVERIAAAASLAAEIVAAALPAGSPEEAAKAATSLAKVFNDTAVAAAEEAALAAIGVTEAVAVASVRQTATGNDADVAVLDASVADASAQ